MNKFLIISILFFSSLSLSAKGQEKLMQEISIEHLSVKRIGGNPYGGGSLWVSFDIEATKDFPRNCEMEIVPTLKSNGQEVEMTGVVVKSRRRLILEQRKGGEGGESDKEGWVICVAGQRVGYVAGVRFEKWMEGGKLYFKRVAKCCTNTTHLTSQTITNNLQLTTKKITPQYAYAKPIKGTENREHKEKGTMFLKFNVASYSIDPKVGENTQELAKIQRIIESMPHRDIVEVELCGSSSPEGDSTYNAKLAKQRAFAVENYMETRYNYPKNIFNITSIGENWRGFKELIENSNLSNKAQILSIINSPLSERLKDQKIAQLPNYPTLLNDYYPQLRVTDFTITYIVHPITLEEVRTIYHTAPNDLSLYDFYTLAINDTLHRSAIFNTCVEVYPNSAIGCINSAIEALKSGDISRAETLLRQAAHTLEIAGNAKPKMVWAVYYNTVGILQIEKGDLESAHRLFSLAKNIGLSQAKENLKNLEKSQQNNGFYIK